MQSVTQRRALCHHHGGPEHEPWSVTAGPAFDALRQKTRVEQTVPRGAPALPGSAFTGTFPLYSTCFTHCIWHYTIPCLGLQNRCKMKSIQLLRTAVLWGIRNGQDSRNTSSVMLTQQSGGQVNVWHLAPERSHCWCCHNTETSVLGKHIPRGSQ